MTKPWRVSRGNTPDTFPTAGHDLDTHLGRVNIHVGWVKTYLYWIDTRGSPGTTRSVAGGGTPNAGQSAAQRMNKNAHVTLARMRRF
jgi:hypothetical protein